MNEPPPARPGSLPGYELLEPISFGATSVVFRGIQPSLGRPVAVKQLLPEQLGSSDSLERFRREARAVASFSHPGVVQILDYIESDGACFIVMEYVSGHDLGRVMEIRGRLAPDEALAIAARVADALWFSHARGIIHRDVKPRNILLSRSGQVKVADFGIARFLGPEEPTTASGFVGTPAYTAPEQILGKRVDGRADIFALGVVLYEMLTGVKPFRNDPESNVVSKILEQDPIPLRTLDRRIPRPLQSLVERCLEKNPDRRFADMLDLQIATRRATSRAERESPRALARLALSLFGPDSDQALTMPEPLLAASPLLHPVRRLGRAGVRRLSLLGTVVATGLGGALLVLFAGRGEAGMAPPLPGDGEGFCKVAAYPWAEVLLDGDPVETTPFDGPLRLAAGEHRLTLRHPDLPAYETTLTVTPGSFQRVRVDLTGGGRFAGEQTP